MKNNLFKHSHLETTRDVEATLNWKLEYIKENNLPIDTGMADYIAFSIDNLDMQLKQIAEAEKQLNQRKQELKKQIETIKIDGAKFLDNMGVDRLDGVMCSSISISKSVEEKVVEEETIKIEYLKTQSEIDALLISMGYAKEKTIIEEKITKARPAKLRINKRKILNSEVLDER